MRPSEESGVTPVIRPRTLAKHRDRIERPRGGEHRDCRRDRGQGEYRDRDSGERRVWTRGWRRAKETRFRPPRRQIEI